MEEEVKKIYDILLEEGDYCKTKRWFRIYKGYKNKDDYLIILTKHSKDYYGNTTEIETVSIILPKKEIIKMAISILQDGNDEGED